MKNARHLTPQIPAACAAALIVLSALASAPRNGAAGSPPAETHAAANIVLGVNSGVTQPMIETEPMSSCSLGVGSGYTWGRMRIVHFDPQTLLPDPTTVALRSREFTPSNLYDYYSYLSNHGRIDFATPLVIRHVDHVADVPSTPVAIDWLVQFQNQLPFYFNDDANPVRPAGYRYSGVAPRTALPGPHPVLNYVARPAGGDAVGQFVVQAVMRSDVGLPGEAYEIAQRFRVPVATSVASIELAIGAGPPTNNWLDVAILAAPSDTPPQELPPAMIEGTLEPIGQVPVWIPTLPLDWTTILHPGVDYWLVARTAGSYSPHARTRTGLEGPDFADAIGPLFLRNAEGAAWENDPEHALCFRLIGSPYSLLDAAPTPGPSRFMLGSAPNPARHGTQLVWSGARGRMRIDVLDVHGRRIESRELSEVSAGTWFWNAKGPDGRRLADGTYFIRARNEAGEVAVHRVVLIR